MSLEMESINPDIMSLGSSDHYVIQEEPKDLTVKRKFRPVPPPLDLSKRNLHLHHHSEHSSPRSPLCQKNLPLRKRAYSWSSQPELGLKSVPEERTCMVQISRENTSTYEKHIYQSTTRSTVSLRISGLPTPHTPQTPHPHSAIPLTSTRFNFNENDRSTFCPSLDIELSNGPLNLSTTSIGHLPSSLLSPAPSHPSSSSLNSSREELETEPMITDCHMASPPAHFSPHQSMVCVPSRPPNAVEFPSESPAVYTSHQWPTGVWSVFLAGVQVHFVLGGGKLTSARLSEELGHLERTHNQQYAPHGLHLLKTNIVEDHVVYNQNGPSVVKSCQHYFRPVDVQQEDILVIAPFDHPFYVRGKGWCSLSVDHATQRYNIPCLPLQIGDVCLPLCHPETCQTPVPVVTPDLTDAMKKFDFNDDVTEMVVFGGQSPALPPLQRSVFLSPPASPSKKSKGSGSAQTNLHAIGENGVPGEFAVAVKSRRPMNGFMLFAKQYRIKLIQQHPGKDNRAISCLLGSMWKSLQDCEKESFNKQARIQAEEKKRIDPDCWKRKRSHSTSSLVPSANKEPPKEAHPNFTPI